MRRRRVLVLGGTGMLGSMVTEVLAEAPDLEVTSTARTQVQTRAAAACAASVVWRTLDLEADTAALDLSGFAWIVSCVGLIKPHIREEEPASVGRAIRLNALLPVRLAEAARAAGARLLLVATDCVWSGGRGAYVETDAHDALDVYGRTKSLGEVRAEGVHHLRCSFVGPERGRRTSLLEWFLGQPRGARVTGFTDHRWNGVTSLALARVVLGIVRGELELPHLQHLVPADAVSKEELLRLFARAYGRDDVMIQAGPGPSPVDRTLATVDPAGSAALWRAAGEASPPRIEALVTALAGRRREA
jgi:dTDP-4-dehydrorhamnose reductase